MIDVPSVNLLHTSTVARWHTQPVDHPYGDPQEALANSSDPSPEQVLAIICQQHQFNFLLWHEEDIARSVDVSDSQIAQVKRNIDKYNQARNDWIE
jgi:hypothetical protein